MFLAATIYRLMLYAKAGREDLTRADLKAWAGLVEMIKRERRR